ncbi:anti-repressor SinI family protein [Sporosarcina globispora]|uniref:anti-repressor SinI family protein n=1 Tax=Sporosarcina globispora TaxID=1459 RepID=UPI000A7309C9|nr:anti-repressor SinI family protein [Sporosarcina globispora]
MKTCEGKIDKEWVELIMAAKQLGLTIADIQEFIKQSKTDKKQGQIPEYHE